jgi:primosomal protein N' (replication factor Y)
LYAEILVDLPARQVDRVFCYLVPARLEGQVVFGSVVEVPFRRQRLTGYVVGFASSPPPGEIREIASVSSREPVFDARQLALARWLAAYYLCPTVSALQAVTGPRVTRPAGWQKGLWPAGTGENPDLKNAPAQEKAWRVALAQPGLTRQELAAAAGVSPGAVDTLVAKGLLAVKKLRKSPFLFAGRAGVPAPEELTVPQGRALGEIASALEKGEPKTFLLFGVTGSGKTEVYCRSLERALRLGRQGIVLVPEIALTAQMIATFQARFGERVAVLHSRLSDGERYDQWLRLKEGEAEIVLGPRSALFAPLARPGLIIIDEEHEPSYKQEENPRYHTRTVARHLAEERGAVVLLGSATPSLESFFAAEKGEYRLLRMEERVESRPLPDVQVVDLRRELKRGNRGLFSRALLAAVGETLARKEKAILFLNRRGFATIVVCRECGLVMKCPHCDVSLTYHASGRLLCHYCHYTVAAPVLCPGCRSRQIGYFGAGTQKIEEEIKRLFPAARVLRLDSDTASRKDSHRLILEEFQREGPGILIGTQMVAKGLDIPSVTLVGVVNADLSLHMPDFRASERTFQLLTQVAGRAGRSDLGGRAVIQTYQPAHYAVQAARSHDYEGFYRKEIAYRRSMSYPPFVHLARFLVSGTSAREVEGAVNLLYSGLKELGGEGEIQFLGPAPAPLSRVRDWYRWHLVLKCAEREALRVAGEEGLKILDRQFGRRLRVALDMEPQNLI